jgi:hypothetical protein
MKKKYGEYFKFSSILKLWKKQDKNIIKKGKNINERIFEFFQRSFSKDIYLSIFYNIISLPLSFLYFYIVFGLIFFGFLTMIIIFGFFLLLLSNLMIKLIIFFEVKFAKLLLLMDIEESSDEIEEILNSSDNFETLGNLENEYELNSDLNVNNSQTFKTSNKIFNIFSNIFDRKFGFGLIFIVVKIPTSLITCMFSIVFLVAPLYGMISPIVNRICNKSCYINTDYSRLAFIINYFNENLYSSIIYCIISIILYPVCLFFIHLITNFSKNIMFLVSDEKIIYNEFYLLNENFENI